MLRITGKKVAVIPIFDSSTIGRIIIPDQAKERCDQGIVKYVGPEVKTVAPGDYVIFSGYTGTLLFIEGEGQLIVMPEEFIVSTILEDISTTIPGLFFIGKDGQYFPATHEQACVLITRAYPGIQVKTPLPSKKDYDKLRGGS